jgi:hypothetical protein
MHSIIIIIYFSLQTLLKVKTVGYFMHKTNINENIKKTLVAKFIGNCGFCFTDEVDCLYIDFPYVSGAYGFMGFDARHLEALSRHEKEVYFLFTHAHDDHFNRKEVRSQKLKTAGPFGIRCYANNYITIDQLNKSGPWHITAFKTTHALCIEHYSYVLEWHDTRIFISGDTKYISVLKKINNIDILISNPLFLKEIVKAKRINDFKKIILCHFRTKSKIAHKTHKKLIVPKQGKTIILNA